MSMTRQHFEAIAATIKNSRIDGSAKLVIASELASTLIRFNSRFEAGRFIRAATGTDN